MFHADGYARFNGAFGEGKASEVACMAHIRRKFVDVFAAEGSAIAGEVIKWIAEPYGVEKQVQDHATQWLWTYNNDRLNIEIGGITPAMKLNQYKMAA